MPTTSDAVRLKTIVISNRPLRRTVAVHCGALLLLCALRTAGPGAAPACPSVATRPTLTQLQEAKRRARDRGVLWRFEKDGRHGYLYGTIHVGKLEWAMPGRVVDQALREADIIAMELDPADPSVAEGINAPQKAQEAPVVSTALWNRLRAQAASVCVPWETLHALPPLMILARLEMLEARWV